MVWEVSARVLGVKFKEVRKYLSGMQFLREWSYSWMYCGLGGQVPLPRAFTLCSYYCDHFSAASGMHRVVEEITQSKPLLMAGSPTPGFPGWPGPYPVEF